MKNNYILNEIDIKNWTCYYFEDLKFGDFDLDNILINEKSYENILVYNISYKTLNLSELSLIKQMDLLEFLMELDS